jgi:acyl-CoA thioesterase
MARACAEAMWADDRASRGLGMVLDEVGPGRARMSMPVTEAMVNGHGMCHGGFIFTLADSAFAFACNTYNERAVAAQCTISYLRPARLGQTLVASAEERQRAGRTGIYDIRVQADDVVIAEFRGHSRTLGEKFFP